jgi:hypothetical protein
LLFVGVPALFFKRLHFRSIKFEGALGAGNFVLQRPLPCREQEFLSVY